MYQIKQIPEDFIVREQLDLDLCTGRYSYFLLKKKNLTTYRAITLVCQKLHLNPKDVGYAGLKDRHALTYQYISIRGNHPTYSIKEADLTLEYQGAGKQPIVLGLLNSNNFELTIRNIENKPNLITSFPNYFDQQRFSKNNAEIGKLLIKKDFKTAASLLNENNHKKLTLALENNSTDYVSAIRQISKKILMLYLHSYQSLLFNQTLNNYVKTKPNHKTKQFDFGELSFLDYFEDIEFELPGFDSNQEDLPKDISPRDFIIRQLPNLSLEKQSRKAFVNPTDIQISKLYDDKLNKGKKLIKIAFTLPKGSYATMFIKALFD